MERFLCEKCDITLEEFSMQIERGVWELLLGCLLTIHVMPLWNDLEIRSRILSKQSGETARRQRKEPRHLMRHK